MSLEGQRIRKLANLKKVKAETDYYLVAARLKTIEEKISLCLFELSKHEEHKAYTFWEMRVRQNYQTFLASQISALRDERGSLLAEYQDAHRNLRLALHTETVIVENGYLKL